MAVLEVRRLQTHFCISCLIVNCENYANLFTLYCDECFDAMQRQPLVVFVSLFVLIVHCRSDALISYLIFCC